MLPRWHIVLGFLFSIILFLIIPGVSWIMISLVFLASVFIDLDHYANAVYKTGNISLFSAFDYYKQKEREEIAERKRGIRRRGDFQFFHTIEFHLLIALLGFVWIGFFYIFMGMAFHSLLDIIDMGRSGMLYRREFVFSNWIYEKIR